MSDLTFWWDLIEVLGSLLAIYVVSLYGIFLSQLTESRASLHTVSSRIGENYCATQKFVLLIIYVISYFYMLLLAPFWDLLFLNEVHGSSKKEICVLNYALISFLFFF